PPPPFTLSSFPFTPPAPTVIYPLSLHDALPICDLPHRRAHRPGRQPGGGARHPVPLQRLWRGARRQLAPGDLLHLQFDPERVPRSEEHTSELQSLAYLVCRLLLEKKKKKNATAS